ncbi:hypothetical protein N2152v2_008354 [Parachlorella kessleri]
MAAAVATPSGAAELYYFPIEDVRSWLAPRPVADGKETTAPAAAAAAAARTAAEAPAGPEDTALPSPAKSVTAKARRSGAWKEQARRQSRAPGAEASTRPRRSPAGPVGEAAPRQRLQQDHQGESAAAGGDEHGGGKEVGGQPGAAASGQQQQQQRHQGDESAGVAPKGEPALAGNSSGGGASILGESGETGGEDSGAGASRGEGVEEEEVEDREAKRQRSQASSALLGGLHLALGSAMTYALLMWLDHSGA